uniref:Protein kinase domain-containing protein n=1 Tax=Esox lucius TaxID=8010 RepID=A0AAY5KGH4_ESOLU
KILKYKKIKKHIVAKHQEEHVLFEKRILKATQSDFIVRLHFAFKDNRYIYMIMDFCVGGEIWTKYFRIKNVQYLHTSNLISISSRAVMFWGCCWATQTFNSVQRFSMGLRSDELLGHSWTLKCF